MKLFKFKTTLRRVKKQKNKLIIILVIFLLSLHFLYSLRYHETDLKGIQVSNQVSYALENLSFDTKKESDRFIDVSFNLTNQGDSWSFRLQDIDLSLFLPLPPAPAQKDKLLTTWFVNEREYNREKVTFNYDSPHLVISGQHEKKIPKFIVALTNNCLGVGYWELSVSQLLETGAKIPIYQGFFQFPRGNYKHLFEQYTKSFYWQQAPNIEAWLTLPLVMDRPPFWNLTINGKKFPIDKLRTVIAPRKNVTFKQLENENRIAQGEQARKENQLLISPARSQLKTWQDIRNHKDIKLIRFVPPGIYKYDSFSAAAVQPKLEQISQLKNVILRDVDSLIGNQTLQELELDFINQQGRVRKLIISGFDWEKLPQLSIKDYNRGLVSPLGYGPSFTEDYETLKQNRPEGNPLFSVMLDRDDRIIDYRHDVGLNGLVMHRDKDDPHLLHLYLMSYERILLVGHYQISI